MDDTEVDYEFVSSGREPRKTKVSSYLFGSWRFIDASNLQWTKIEDTLHTHVAEDQMGVIFDRSKKPTDFVERLNPGDTLIRDSSVSPPAYHKKTPDIVL